MTGLSIEKIKKVAEELKRTPTKGLEKEETNPIRNAISNGARIVRDDRAELIQERLKLEKILQEINNLKGRICQRIGLIKTLERGKKEMEKTSNFSEEAKKKLDNLRGHI